MFWLKKKNINDYYKNELMRSRMSPISIRTDEIIQQYFFVSREDCLTLDEYLRVRELATKELKLTIPTPIEVLDSGKVNQQNYTGSETVDYDNQPKVDLLYPDKRATVNSSSSTSSAVITAKDKPKEKEKDASLPFEDKMSLEGCSGFDKAMEEKEKKFDFLAMMQSVED
jgi:hypothetical protein